MASMSGSAKMSQVVLYFTCHQFFLSFSVLAALAVTKPIDLQTSICFLFILMPQDLLITLKCHFIHLSLLPARDQIPTHFDTGWDDNPRGKVAKDSFDIMVRLLAANSILEFFPFPLPILIFGQILIFYY